MTSSSPPRAAAAVSENLRGAAYMTFAMMAFSVNDIITKSFAGQLGVGQMVLLRGLFAIVLVFLLARFLGQMRPLRLAFHPLVAIRSTAEVIASYAFITALFHMPIANVSAVMQALPLALTLAAALFFREKVGWRRLSAVAVGFIGVLIIVRPGAQAFNSYSIYVIVAVLGCVVRDIATRKLTTDIPSLFVALVTTVLVTAMGGVLALFQPWMPVTQSHVGLMAACSVFLLTGYYFAVTAMRVGEIGFVSPFRYSVLLFAIAGGALVFSEIPDGMTLFGSAIVVATGIYTLYRERLVRRQSITPAPMRS